MSYRGKTRIRRQPIMRLTSGAQASESSPPADWEQEGYRLVLSHPMEGQTHAGRTSHSILMKFMGL